MGKRFVLAALLVCFLSTSASAQWNRHQRRGTIIGGVAGAAIGAAIGDRGNNEAVGAVIGGVTGAVIGNNIGANKDHRIEHSGQRHYIQPHYTQPHYTQPHYTQPHYTQPHYSHRYPGYPQPAPVIVPVPVQIAPPVAQGSLPITQVDVLNMLRSGLSEAMVATQIQRRGIVHTLSVNDIIGLHQQGVSERLIDLMQASVVAGAPQSQSHTSYSLPVQPPVQSPMQQQIQPSVQPAVILNNANGQSILAPSIEYPAAN